jgi:hypothetical protein
VNESIHKQANELQKTSPLKMTSSMKTSTKQLLSSFFWRRTWLKRSSHNEVSRETRKLMASIMRENRSFYGKSFMVDMEIAKLDYRRSLALGDSTVAESLQVHYGNRING